MADKQKVLKGFECHRNGFCFSCPYNDDVIETTNCKRQLVEDAIELLKEQEAVEPILKRKGKSKMYNDYVCPRCNEEVVYDQNYCPECGAKFMWEGR